MFQNLPLMACSLTAVGILIIIAGFKDEKTPAATEPAQPVRPKATPLGAFGTPSAPSPQATSTFAASGLISMLQAAIIGAVQGLALPFRGFSRSGSTISTGILLGVPRMTAEEFSFALAVILTPVVIAREVWMLIKPHAHAAVDVASQAAASAATAVSDTAGSANLSRLLLPGLLGMAFSFVAGLIALKWLSSWLEKGRWKFFGFYCLAAAAVVLCLHFFQR